MPFALAVFAAGLAARAPAQECAFVANRPGWALRVDGTVTIDEIMTLVNIALGTAPTTSCPAADANHDGQVTIDEILAAAVNAIQYHVIGTCWTGLSQQGE